MESLESQRSKCAFLFSTQDGLQTHLSISFEVSRQYHSGHITICKDASDLTVSRKHLRCKERKKRQCLDRHQKHSEVGLSYNEPLNSCTYSHRNIDAEIKRTNCNEILSTLSGASALSSDDSAVIVLATFFLYLCETTNYRECISLLHMLLNQLRDL